MSPTVPPISVMMMSPAILSATSLMRALISLVTCGMTWTVRPWYLPARSLSSTLWYTWPLVRLLSRDRLVWVKRS